MPQSADLTWPDLTRPNSTQLGATRRDPTGPTPAARAVNWTRTWDPAAETFAPTYASRQALFNKFQLSGQRTDGGRAYGYRNKLLVKANDSRLPFAPFEIYWHINLILPTTQAPNCRKSRHWAPDEQSLGAVDWMRFTAWISVSKLEKKHQLYTYVFRHRYIYTYTYINRVLRMKSKERIGIKSPNAQISYLV